MHHLLKTTHGLDNLQTAICRRIFSQHFFHQYFCELLENSCSASKKKKKNVPKIFGKFTKNTRGKSYFSKVASFYRSNHRRCSVKGVLRKVFAKFKGKHLCQRLYFNKVCRPKAVKKRLWHKCFPLNLAKFLRTPLLQNTSRWLLLLLAFQKQPQEVLYEIRCSWKFCKIYRKTTVVV